MPLERQDSLHLQRRQYHRLLRRGDVQVLAHVHARRRRHNRFLRGAQADSQTTDVQV